MPARSQQTHSAIRANHVKKNTMTSKMMALTCSWRASQAAPQASITHRGRLSPNANPHPNAHNIMRGGNNVFGQMRKEKWVVQGMLAYTIVASAAACQPK